MRASTRITTYVVFGYCLFAFGFLCYHVNELRNLALLQSSHSQWLDAKEKREERQEEEQLERCALVLARFGQMADHKTYSEEVALRVWEFCNQNPGVTRQEP